MFSFIIHWPSHVTWRYLSFKSYVYIYIYIYMCVCVCYTLIAQNTGKCSFKWDIWVRKKIVMKWMYETLCGILIQLLQNIMLKTSVKWTVVMCGHAFQGYAINANVLNTLRPRQNGRYFPDDIFKRIFLYENVLISIIISLKFVPMGPINNIPALVQIMAWRRPGDKPLSEAMMVSLLTHICVTRPQWVNVP